MPNGFWKMLIGGDFGWWDYEQEKRIDALEGEHDLAQWSVSQLRDQLYYEIELNRRQSTRIKALAALVGRMGELLEAQGVISASDIAVEVKRLEEALALRATRPRPP